MKTVASQLSTAIRQAYNVYCKPRLTAEFNFNRHYNATADNVAPEAQYAYNPDLFPIESIIGGLRPTRGICKAFIGQATVREYSETAPAIRYYVAGADDTYKHWISPVPTTGTTFPVYNQAWVSTITPGRTDAGDSGSVVRPYVAYDTAGLCNKIVITVENSHASPTNYSVSIRTTPGGGWTSIASNPTIDGNGRIILYRQSGGTWSATPPAAGTDAPVTNVAGVMLTVGGMTASNSYLSVIEISARREVDMSSRLIDVDYTSELSEPSVVYPIGTINTSTATLTLSNVDGYFNAENLGSPYYGLLDANVKFTLNYVYTINGTVYTVQEFEMWGGPWRGQRDEVISMECFDASKFLQEVKPQKVFYQDVSASEVVYRLCDMVGFTDYIVSESSTATTLIPYFWTDGEQTVWEVLDEVARATQTAIYFDSYGKLRIKSREAAFNTAASPVWTLKGQTDSETDNDLADIITLDQDDELGTNYVKVTYEALSFPLDENGWPKRQVVWEPEGTVVLRASPLRSSITSSDMILNIGGDAAKVWPYSGILNVQGELIRYEGKKYASYSGAGGSLVHKIVKSKEDKDVLDKKTPANKRIQNYFTGGLEITERGLWNSEAKAHNVEISGWNSRHLVGSTHTNNVNGLVHNKAESLLHLRSTPGITNVNEFLWATRGAEIDSGFRYFGTRLRFNNNGRSSQRAGLCFNINGSNMDGYYVEVQQTKKIDRTQRNEITVFTRKGGSNKNVAGTGAAKFVTTGRFYDLEVKYIPGSPDRIIVYWNGVKTIDCTVTGGDQNASNGKFGMHLRGPTDVSYEYFYAVNRTDRDVPDESNFWDRVRTAYSSEQWDKEWVFERTKTSRRVKRKTGKETYRRNKVFMDEFGPICHEVREYDVKFDPAPVLDSRIFIDNGGVVCADYVGDSFGAKFVIGNASRKNAVAYGEDTLAFAGSGQAVNRTMFCYGRVAEIAEQEEIIAKNDAQIATRGKIETEIASQWIQTKEGAQSLADWIEQHWSKGADVLSVTTFGNPMLELCDVVDILYYDRQMYPVSHKYFVVGISNNFQSGLESTFTLRRLT